MTNRNEILSDKAQLETLLLALDGIGPDMSDKACIRAICRCLYHLLDFILGRTWGA